MPSAWFAKSGLTSSVAGMSAPAGRDCQSPNHAHVAVGKFERVEVTGDYESDAGLAVLQQVNVLREPHALLVPLRAYASAVAAVDAAERSLVLFTGCLSLASPPS